MSRKSRRRSETIPLTGRDMERFHENARAALARRSPSTIAQEVGEGFQLVVWGFLPIGGLVFLDWAPSQMLSFLLVGAWVGAICDVLKLVYLHRAIMDYAKARYDDWHVWVVVEALRSGSKEAPQQHLRAHYQPGSGVVVDVVFGGIGSALIVVTMRAGDPAFPFGGLGDSSFAWALGAFVVYQLGLTLWEIATRRGGGGSDGPVRVAVGLRGVGLFLLMFLVLMAVGENGEHPEGARFVVLIVNGLLILLGLLGISTPLVLRGETRWLRDYLDRRDGGPLPT